VSELVAILTTGVGAAWDLGSGGWPPVVAALALVVAHSPGGRRALAAGLAFAVGSVAGVPVLAGMLASDRSLPARALGQTPLDDIALALVILPAVVLLVFGVSGARGGRWSPAWLLAATALSMGLGTFLLASVPAQLLTVMASQAMGEPGGLVVSVLAVGLGLAVQPFVPIAWLAACRVGDAAPILARRVRVGLLALAAVAVVLTPLL